MDKMQQDFEAWHKSVVAGDPPHEKYNSGDYRCQHVQRYWFGWRASRESLMIEVPEFDGWPASMESEMRNAFRNAIEAAGLKVKP